MSQLDDFLSGFIPRLLEAEEALHNGDVEPRLRLWSRREPLTLLGAFGVARTGPAEVDETFRWVASRFSDCTSYRFELVAADVRGDLAYTVGYEHVTNSTDGDPPTSFTLRVTHIFRREEEEWTIVHRHADGLGRD